MARLKLLGGLGTVLVVALVAASLAGVAPALAADTGALMAFALVVVVAAAIVGMGLAGRRNARNPYW